MRTALTGNRGFALRALVLATVVAAPHFALAQQASTAAGSQAPASATRLLDTTASRDSVVRLARQQLGRRYVFGGTTPSGFDCSGFTKYLMRAMGVELPRTAAQQARVGTEIPRDISQLRPGDLLTFRRGGRISHIGMYIGDGKYIHASSAAGRIVEARLDRQQSRLMRAWAGVRRVLAGRDSVAAPNTTVATTVTATPSVQN